MAQAKKGKRTRDAEAVGQTGNTGKLKRAVYERQLAKLHVELVKLQRWVAHEGLKVCVVFEGRDGAGKGGTIKAITERVSPRVFHLVALPAPTEREKTQMYAQRTLPHLPAAGEIVIFDRSWYNRAGVERVTGFCTEEQAKRFLQIVPEFEHVVVEFWHDPVEVLARGEPRRTDPTTQRTHQRRAKDLEAVPMDLESIIAGSIILVPATRCSRRAIRRGHHGLWFDRTIRDARD